MKITLEPRKETRVPFLRSPATMNMEHRIEIAYSTYSVKDNSTPTVNMRYMISGIRTDRTIPPSQLVILQQGVPVTVTHMAGSPAPGKLHSTWVDDPLVEVLDRVSRVEKKRTREKRLSSRVIERFTDEIVTRQVKIENKTGKALEMELTVQEDPASGITFVEAKPAPKSSQPPEHHWELSIPVEGVATVAITLEVKRVEKIELPPDRIGGDRKPRGENYDLDDILTQAVQEEPYFANNDEQIIQ
jgi:hypothetical protein